MSTAAATDFQPYEDPQEPAAAPPPRKTGVASARRVPDPTRQHARGPSGAGAPKAPPEPVTAPRAPFVLLVLVLVAAGIVGLLVLNTKINENSFRLEGLRDRQAVLDIREQQLGSELAGRQSPGNLEAAAKRLGLVRADTPAFLRLPDGRVLGVPRPGGARTGNGG